MLVGRPFLGSNTKVVIIEDFNGLEIQLHLQSTHYLTKINRIFRQMSKIYQHTALIYFNDPMMISSSLSVISGLTHQYNRWVWLQLVSMISGCGNS